MGDSMTVTDFVRRYYRPDRLRRQPGLEELIIANRERDLRETGSCLISRHDCVTGEMVVLYDPTRQPRIYIPAEVET